MFCNNIHYSLNILVTVNLSGPEYRVRLVDSRYTGSGSSLIFEGRVELFVDGEWGIVCDTNWDQVDADVVCKELGFSGAIQATVGDYFGEPPGVILMDNVNCSENHKHLSHCPHNGWYQHGDRCYSRTVAGVICDPGIKTSKIRCNRDKS